MFLFHIFECECYCFSVTPTEDARLKREANPAAQIDFDVFDPLDPISAYYIQSAVEPPSIKNKWNPNFVGVRKERILLGIATSVITSTATFTTTTFSLVTCSSISGFSKC